jgi:DNA uptake protein ComE-like DNA-binding protein
MAYFVFSKKERTGIYVLLGIMAVFILLPIVYNPSFTAPAIDTALQQKLNTPRPDDRQVLAGKPGDSSRNAAPAASFASTAKPEKEVFYFDPNTLPADGWKRLGFRDKTIENIMHYRGAVAKFSKAEDLYNVPRIRKKAVEAILPYVRMGTAYSAATTGISALKPQPAILPAAVKPGTYKTINVNAATADDFKVFPGITDAVANRIIKFRTSINGFKAIDDVAKTYGLRDSTFAIMRPYLIITQP